MKERVKVFLLVVTLAAVEASTTQSTSAATTEDSSSCKIELKPNVGESRIQPSIEKKYMALLLLLGFGGFSLLIAGVYKSLRKYVFHDEHNLDTVFDAGGRVSLSLTAVTVTSQLLWPADFLMSPTLVSKSGLGGSLWMATGVVVDILLFPALSIYLKTRAPGAKTFPTIAYARFGKTAHIVFCILALLSSLITSTSMLLAGKSAMDVLGKDMNSEFVYLVLAVLFGSYCMLGGLGTTFYISYFNTALTFVSVSVYVIYTSYFPNENTEKYSSIKSMYDATICIKTADGNYNNSLLTLRTENGLIYGIVLLFMATSISFTDQANWQSRIAAKPTQGVLGFFMAAYMWFVIPLALGFTTSMSYMTQSYENGTHILSVDEIENGYITPYIFNLLMGETGGYLLLTMLMMALMSTGSGEVMAVSSIIVYDIYKTYINPYRKNVSPTACVLCGLEKSRGRSVGSENGTGFDETCHCSSVIGCKMCRKDIEVLAGCDIDTVTYTCTIHGDYRRYEDGLMRYKSWCMVWVIICIVPYGLLVTETGMNVTWATLSTQVLTTPFLLPLFSTITWSKATSKGVVAGSITGTILSIAALLIMGSTYDGGLSNFYVNTSQSYSLLAAMACGFVVSGVTTVVVSLCTHNIKTEDDVEREWAKTIGIDNPINPYRLIYEEDFQKMEVGSIITAKTMDKVFRKTRMYATVGGAFSLVIFLVVIPAVALSYGELTFDEFSTWVKVFQVYLFICTCIVVIFPPFEEGYQIWKRYKRNKETRSKNSNHGNGGTKL